ncbi:hypothetical protein Q5P01_001436 [Channa striata]|uniref:Uncharacterized protein n=1 Tax=Channa striata TaxID=64152 RepID=A0AA88T591_CHASR|nr:hypothetical protein Q5P01_001436 [Channa striata]
MNLQLWWLILIVECIFICSSSQSISKRQCVFQVKPQNNNYTTAGNVNDSVQVCDNTHCCVSYYLVVNGQPEVDVLV